MRGVKPFKKEDFAVMDLPFDQPGDTYLIRNYSRDNALLYETPNVTASASAASFDELKEDPEVAAAALADMSGRMSGGATLKRYVNEALYLRFPKPLGQSWG